MNKAILSVVVIMLVGCGIRTEDQRDDLTKEQVSAIDERTKSYGVVGVSSEPVGYFTGPYVVHGTVIESAAKIAAAPAGAAKYAACSACHGAQGQGGVGPMLAGQSATSITESLTAYRNKEQRGAQSALMWGQAAALSDQDIQDLAEYIETL